MTQTGQDVSLPLDVERIMGLLPHRFPFLLVDRITEIEEDKRIVGYKNISANEHYISADGADGPGFANRPRDFAVTSCFAKGDFPEFTPDGLLECRAAGQIKRRQDLCGASGKDVFQRGLSRTVPLADIVGNRQEMT